MNPQIQKLIDVTVNALKSRHFPTVHAALVNFKGADGAPVIVINPDAQPVVYATLLALYDPRFADMEEDLGAYLEWIKAQIAAANTDEERAS